MPTFYLVRHGEKEKIMGDPPLSDVGRKQAEVTASFLKDFSIAALYASPLTRAKQTAEIFSKALGLSLHLDKRLLERMNWGDKEGETFEAFLAEWEKGTKDRNYQPNHGDSAFKTGKRIEEFLKQQHNGNVLIVSHGGAIGDFLQNVFTDLPLIVSPAGVKYVHILECSVTTVRYDQDTFSLEKLNDIAHLPVPLL